MSKDFDMSTSMEMLIKGQDNLNQQIGKLSDRIGELVNIEAARAQRDQQQDERNKKVEDFMTEYEDTLRRTRRFHKLIDNSMVRVVGGIIFGIVSYVALTSMGIDPFGVTK